MRMTAAVEPFATRTCPARHGLASAVFACIALLLSACGNAELPTWNKRELAGEFSADNRATVTTFDDYLQLEARLFKELDEDIYGQTDTGPEFSLVRYSRGSLSDPEQRQPNWNRSFELLRENPSGAVLLLHGMTDSPYSLRALGQHLHRQGFRVLGLRLPGHGTAPSGMLKVDWRDMRAAVKLAMSHLAQQVGEHPIHIIGYSTGAALALDYSLEVEAGAAQPAAASLVLISPAVGISPAAALAKWKRRLGLVPGLGSMAWLQVEPEFDPYKYNSFATNAAEQVHSLTRSVASRIAARPHPGPLLPPMLILKSTVDATVSTSAVVDRLLLHLEPRRHELVLFDINRFAATSSLLVKDPAPLTRRLIADNKLPFGLTLVANASADSRAVEAYYKAPFASEVSASVPLEQQWPQDVFSLSHVALPFPPEDPLYGSTAPGDRKTLFLGQQAFQGERGVLKVPGDFMLRLRHNPFYSYLQKRVTDWLEAAPPQT